MAEGVEDAVVHAVSGFLPYFGVGVGVGVVFAPFLDGVFFVGVLGDDCGDGGEFGVVDGVVAHYTSCPPVLHMCRMASLRVMSFCLAMVLALRYTVSGILMVVDMRCVVGCGDINSLPLVC